MIRLALVVAVVTLSACTLDFGDDGGDDACLAGEEGAYDPGPGLLNPETLVCESFSYPCDPGCGPCTAGDQAAVPMPTWAYCGNGCEALAEEQCRATTACRAVYDYDCWTNGTCELLIPFLGCYGVDNTGPIQGACAGLLAWECSQHDDCIALHRPQCSGDGTQCWQQFVECIDEATCYGEVICERLPPPCESNSLPAIKNGCYTGECIPLEHCEPCPTCI